MIDRERKFYGRVAELAGLAMTSWSVVSPSAPVAGLAAFVAACLWQTTGWRSAVAIAAVSFFVAEPINARLFSAILIPLLELGFTPSINLELAAGIPSLTIGIVFASRALWAVIRRAA